MRRHLHYDPKATPRALCGVHARATVHFSKARRTDCPRCRQIHRANLHENRHLSEREMARQLTRDRFAAAHRGVKVSPTPPVELPGDLGRWDGPDGATESARPAGLPAPAFLGAVRPPFLTLRAEAARLVRLGALLPELKAEVERAFWGWYSPSLPAEPARRLVSFRCGHRAPLDPARPDWCERCEQLTLDNENREEDNP